MVFFGGVKFPPAMLEHAHFENIKMNAKTRLHTKLYICIHVMPNMYMPCHGINIVLVWIEQLRAEKKECMHNLKIVFFLFYYLLFKAKGVYEESGKDCIANGCEIKALISYLLVACTTTTPTTTTTEKAKYRIRNKHKSLSDILVVWLTIALLSIFSFFFLNFDRIPLLLWKFSIFQHFGFEVIF